MIPMEKWLLVMLGGSLGAASRYGVSLLSARLLGTQFPYGTMLVNLAGCFLIGLLFALADRSRLLTPDVRLLLITGYLGALTTARPCLPRRSPPPTPPCWGIAASSSRRHR